MAISEIRACFTFPLDNDGDILMFFFIFFLSLFLYIYFFKYLFIYLLYIAKLLTKINNTLHYLHYSRYLQHSTTLRFFSLLHTH